MGPEAAAVPTPVEELTLRFARLTLLGWLLATIPIVASDTLSLAQKARVFDADLVERFLSADGQVSSRRRLPTDDRPYVTYNMADAAYMTGLYSAAQTWRHLATADPEAARHARGASAALRHLATVSARRGLVARGSIPIGDPWFDDGIWRETPDGQHRWRGSVSSDQVASLMFGSLVYATHLADAQERDAIAQTIADVVDAIVANDYRIIGYDGQPTLWGHYELAYVTSREPMNALLMLQMVKIAATLTEDSRYDDEYDRLVSRGYARIGEAARHDDPPLEANHSDDVLIALALFPLLELEDDPHIRERYLAAARGWFRGGVNPGVDVEGNPFANFLWRHWTGDRDHDRAALDALRQVPLDMKWNADTIATYAARFGFTFTPDPVVASGHRSSPLPMSDRGRTWSFLVHNPYRVGLDRSVAAPFETNGLDYLVSYWFGRAHGMVASDQ